MKPTKRLKIGFITSELENLNLRPETASFDSTWQLLEYGKKKHNVRYILDTSIQGENSTITGLCYEVTNLEAKEKLVHEKREDLTSFDALIIRKDPPFDQQYLAIVQLLATIENSVQIVNRPSALATYNEKTNVLLFPQYAPKSLVTCSISEIKTFLKKHTKGIILKGLDNKGGSNIFMIKPKDPNTNEIIYQMTHNGRNFIMCQELLNIHKNGDKRITVVNGKIMGGFLRRPGKDDFRGNINKGATAIPATPTPKEKAMAKAIATFFMKQGVPIIGIDIIDGKCTEVNITSPLLSKKFMPTIENVFYDYIEQLCTQP